jgi:sec-independent protein translocase protein TatB
MLDVGFSEVLLTSAIALIVLGPERLPKVARQVGNWMGRARAMARQLSEQLEREVSEVDALNKQVNSLNVDNMLKAPITPAPNSPNSQSIAAPDHTHTPSFAPPADAPPADAPPADAPPADAPRASVAEPPAIPPEPVYGLAAAATTAAAMHAADPKVTDPHAAVADASSPHD